MRKFAAARIVNDLVKKRPKSRQSLRSVETGA
jgi:hypothetical protein